MDKQKLKEVYSLLAFLCFIGIAIANVGDSEGAYYFGIGVTLAGASMKILTKRGALILAAGVLGNILLKSTTPLYISASLLACWYLFEFQFSEYNK